MNKPYYKDFLAADWMEKHFGMKFSEEGIEWREPNEKGARIGTSSRRYIHPDSLLGLSKIPDIKKAAMKELGLWPHEEQDS